MRAERTAQCLSLMECKAQSFFVTHDGMSDVWRLQSIPGHSSYTPRRRSWIVLWSVFASCMSRGGGNWKQLLKFRVATRNYSF